jgi:branched-chain amino acid transport system substrate-binding protein
METRSCTFLDGGTFLLLIICVFFISTGVVAENTDPANEIILYAVFPSIGDLSPEANAIKAGLQMSVDDMNSFYQDIKSDTRVSMNSTEISSDPDSALIAIKELENADIHLVLGYFSSAQLSVIKPYADTHDMVILAIGSSATSLSVDDTIFRFNPDDSNQAEVITSLLTNANITDIVPLVRDDVWGNELVSAIYERVGTDTAMDNIKRYDPEEQSYDEVVARLDQQVGSILEEKEANKVAVLAITFSEISPIMKKASDQKYPNLSQVRWFGTDGNTLQPVLTDTPQVSDFCIDQNFTGTAFHRGHGITETSITNRFIKDLGYDPDGYAYAMYDMGKIAVMVLSLNGSDESEALSTAVNEIANRYHGISGETKLNEVGDRSESNYAFWIVDTDSVGDRVWKKIGEATKWDPETAPKLYMDEQ